MSSIEDELALPPPSTSTGNKASEPQNFQNSQNQAQNKPPPSYAQANNQVYPNSQPAVVIVQQPTIGLPPLGSSPQHISKQIFRNIINTLLNKILFFCCLACPNCKAQVVTRTTYKMGLGTWLICFLLWFFG